MSGLETDLPRCEELFKRLRWDIVISALDLAVEVEQVLVLPMGALKTLPGCTTPALVHGAFQNIRTWIDSLREPLLRVETSTRG